MAAENTVFIEKEGHVSWLVINRPQQMNAMSMSMINGLRDVPCSHSASNVFLVVTYDRSELPYNARHHPSRGVNDRVGLFYHCGDDAL